VSAQTPVDVWRGIAVDEEEEEMTASLSVFMRRRSLRLLGELIRPERGKLIAGTVLVVVHSLAGLVMPLLIGRAIDHGIRPALEHHASLRTLYEIVAVFVVVQVIEAVTLRGFLSYIGVVGERVLFRLRTMVFDHFQKLSVAFYEKYTTGRIMSRLGNDIDSISDLFLTGLVDLPWAVTARFVIVLICGKLPTKITGDIKEQYGFLKSISHLGISVESRAEVDRLAEMAREDGCLLLGPMYRNEVVGYICVVTDPDGNNIEFSVEQDLG